MRVSDMTAGEFKTIREGLKYSQTELAASIGVTGNSVYSWESGRRPIPLLAAKLLRFMAKYEEKNN